MNIDARLHRIVAAQPYPLLCEVESNLVTLNEWARLSWIPELIERKTRGENTTITDADLGFYEAEYLRWRGELQAAHDASTLPELPAEETRAALNDLLIRVRLQGLKAGP